MDKLKALFTKYFNQVRNFLIVGFTVTAIDFVLLHTLTERLHLFYLVSTIISFTISTIINYILSMTFVFKGREGRSKSNEFITFAVLNTIGLGLTTLLMWIFVSKMHIYYMFGKVLTTGIVMFYSFFSRKIFLEQH